MTPQPGISVQQAPTPKIKVRTVLVNTPVTVTNASGEMVHSLEATDFKVTDNGAPQRISHFTLGGDPISLAVVVEVSARIEPLLPEIRKTGILITQTVIGPTGEGAVVAYDDRVSMLADFTNNLDSLEKTMSGLREGSGGARLFDAMSKAVEMLSARPEVADTELGKRRVMLVIGEAHDSGSEEKLGEVLRRAQLANVTIYTVGLSGLKADLKKKSKEEAVPRATPDGIFGMPGPPGTVQTPSNDASAQGGVNLLALAVWAVIHAKDRITAHQLEIASAATGGLHVSAWKSHTIEEMIDDIGGELHSQYTITYTPTDAAENGYHEIRVTVDRKDLSVRARPGYYIEGPQVN